MYRRLFVSGARLLQPAGQKQLIRLVSGSSIVGPTPNPYFEPSTPFQTVQKVQPVECEQAQTSSPSPPAPAPLPPANANAKDSVKSKSNNGNGKANKRKRQKRALRNEVQPGQEVKCVALAEELDLVFEILLDNEIFAHQFHIIPVSSPPMRNFLAIHCQYRNQPRLSSDGEEPVIQEFYVFADGVVVFWNIEPQEREHIIAHLKMCETNPFDASLTREEEEMMNVQFTLNPSNAGNDTIYLNRNVHTELANSHIYSFDSSNPLQERFAFSHALAASVRIGVLEGDLDNLDDKLRKCIEPMRKGNITWGQSEAMQMIAEITNIRHVVNGTDLLDKDIYWDLNKAEQVYNSLAKCLKLERRRTALNERIDYCQDFSNTVYQMLDQKKSHRLEWIIIALIAVEVVVNMDKLLDILRVTLKNTAEAATRAGTELRKIELFKKPLIEPEDEFEVNWRDRLLSIFPYFVLVAMVALVLKMDVGRYKRIIKRYIWKRAERKKNKRMMAMD